MSLTRWRTHQIDVPASLIGARILKFEKDEGLGWITLFAVNDGGEEFEIEFISRADEVELEIKNNNQDNVQTRKR